MYDLILTPAGWTAAALREKADLILVWQECKRLAARADVIVTGLGPQ